jgi:D-alanyl-D-alanine carboxypeptidase
VASPSGPVQAGPYVVVDPATGETLLERNAGAYWYPASLTKMMTIYIIFEELKAGRLTLATPVPLSEHARSMPPSKLGLGPGQSVTVEQGLQSLVARSANDMATAFGELISGSSPAFAQRMTETATRLGMTATQFRNANGLPDQGQITTARDMAILAMALVKQFPEYYGYFHTQEFLLGKTRIGPGIKFLDLYAPYADGLKTGFICASGFNIVGSAVRDGRRLIAVAFGFRRADLRDEFIVRLLDEAYALKTGGNRPKVWQLRNGDGGPGTVFAQNDCGGIRYDMPGDAVWLGTFGDWKTARYAFDTGQADLVRLGQSRLGKEYILPVTSNKVTKQAAIIADLEPAAAQKLCADYQARKLFCQVKKPEEFVPPFGVFWR